MSDKKTLCEWEKNEIEKKSAELIKLITDAKYYCKKCARSANDKEVLCKPKKIGKGNQNLTLNKLAAVATSLSKQFLSASPPGGWG